MKPPLESELEPIRVLAVGDLRKLLLRLAAKKITREWFEQNSDLAQLLWAEMHIREYEKLGDPAGVWALVADEKGEEHILPSNRVLVPTTKEIPLSDAGTLFDLVETKFGILMLPKEPKEG